MEGVTKKEFDNLTQLMRGKDKKLWLGVNLFFKMSLKITLTLKNLNNKWWGPIRSKLSNRRLIISSFNCSNSNKISKWIITIRSTTTMCNKKISTCPEFSRILLSTNLVQEISMLHLLLKNNYRLLGKFEFSRVFCAGKQTAEFDLMSHWFWIK